ncbi:MAG TPA: TlpA disulfide reductase family protein [Hyphomonadaceae bacterium]|nr:TlpA disulfide reductase family protein [Hyphomonadaceae bacterium]HPN06298.1 TlpA disulfide reductase family protein [Hyphomonadaceae bacterium]
MSLRPVISAALLALFAAACQPASAPAAEAPATTETAAAPETAAPASASQLASFKTGQFENLDFDTELSIPTAKFVDAEGKEHSFAEYAGKVVVYNIWAEWCGPCVEEMPSLARLQKAFAGKDVAVIPVAFGFGKGVTRETTLAKFKELVGTDLPFYYDGELAVNGEAQTGALPATIIYDKTGKEVARLIYPAHWDAPDAVALVQAVLDGQS